MKVLSFISQKGGVGKTTASLNLAIAAEREGLTTVLLDLDPQASSASLGDVRSASSAEDVPPEIMSIQAARLGSVLEAAAGNGVDLVIIDTPPHANDVCLAAARASDMVLVPCCPSIIDAMAIKNTVQIVSFAKVPAFGLVSIAPPPPHVRPSAELEETMKAMDLAVCPVRLTRRVAFQHSLTNGLGVVEIAEDSTATKAIEEIKALLTFIREQLDLKEGTRVEASA